MKYLKAWLKFRGISAYRLIQMTGIQPMRIYSYVYDREERPPASMTVRRIARALECDPEELLSREPEEGDRQNG